MALEIISSFCQRHGNIELTVFTNPIAGIEQVKKIKPNILFLDIEMEDINGRDLARMEWTGMEWIERKYIMLETRLLCSHLLKKHMVKSNCVMWADYRK
mgnify:CR=1 FL=1